MRFKAERRATPLSLHCADDAAAAAAMMTIGLPDFFCRNTGRFGCVWPSAETT